MLNVLCGTYGRMLFLSNQSPILWDRLFPLILSAAFTISMIILLCAPFSFYCTELYCIEINLAKKINNLARKYKYTCLTSPPYHKLIWNLLLLLLLLRIFTGNKEQGIKRSLWSERASISWSLISPMSLQVTLFRPSLIHATKPMGDGLSHCWKFSWPKLEYRTNVVNTGQNNVVDQTCKESSLPWSEER